MKLLEAWKNVTYEGEPIMEITPEWAMTKHAGKHPFPWRHIFHLCEPHKVSLVYLPTIPKDQMVTFCKHCGDKMPPEVQQAIYTIGMIGQMR